MHSLILSLLFLAQSAIAAPCAHPLSVIFYAGNRYYDGFGDLALNKSVIDHQVSELRAKYGECVKINIGFLEERLHPMSNFRGYEANKKIYKQDAETAALDRFSEMKTGKYFDTKTKITYWSENALNQISYLGHYEKKFDLGVMMSELTWSVPAENNYHLPKFANATNMVSFQEYEKDFELHGLAKLNAVDSAVNKDFHLNLKIKSGFGNAGALIDQRDENLMNARQLKDWLKETIEHVDEKLVVQNLGIDQKSLSRFLAEPKINYLTSYLSAVDLVNYAKPRAYESILTAYYDAQYLLSHGKKPGKYVIVSNQLQDAELSEFYEIQFRTQPDAAFKAKFEQFLKEDTLVLGIGSKGLSVTEMRSLYDPLNGSIYSQTAGFGSLNDVLSLGGVPFPQWRRYHQLDLAKAMLASGKRQGYSPEVLERIDGFLFSAKNFRSNSKDSAEEVGAAIAKRVSDFHELQPYLQTIVNDLKQNDNLHQYISDVISQFYAAKQINPNSPAEALIEKTLPGNEIEIQKSPFLKTLASPQAYPYNGATNPFKNCLKNEFLKFRP